MEEGEIGSDRAGSPGHGEGADNENGVGIGAIPPVAAAVAPSGDHTDQQDSESQAASDAAVAGKREKGKSRKRSRAISSNNAAQPAEANIRPLAAPAVAAPAAAAAGPGVGSDLTFPNPKNFAERLMNALQSGLAPDCIRWTSDGKAVALHQKNLKKGTIMSSYFHVVTYAAFIRNFNRWGFQRVADISVTDGMINYKNGLFKRDEPLLVKRMRMDSNVQHLFQRQQESSVPKCIEFSESDQQGALQNHELGSESALSPHQQQLIDWLNGSSWATQSGPPAMPLQPQVQQSPQPPQQPQPQPPTPLQQQQQQWPEDLASALATILSQAAGRATSNNDVSVLDSLFSQIVDLAQQYLNQPTSIPIGNPTIVLILQLLLVVDKQMKQATIEQQLQGLLTSTFQSQQSPAYAPAPSLSQAATSLQPPSQNNTTRAIQALQGLLRSSDSQQPPSQSVPNQARPADTAASLLQLLVQHGQQPTQPQSSSALSGSSGQQQRSQQVQPQQSNGRMQQSSQSAEGLQALLLRCMQQQQQNQNHSTGES